MNERGIPAWRVNAFTTQPFTGNPAGVVPEGDGLAEALMLDIAGELNDVSETVFICRPQAEGADIRLRYYTKTTEVDLCGHATISALFVLAWLGRIRAETPDGTASVRAETRVGVLDLGVKFEGGEPAWALMEQPSPQFHQAAHAGLAAEILGLPASALSDGLQAGCASTGLWACFVPLRDLSALRRVRIDSARIAELWPENPELTGVYPFVLLDGQTTQGRFFSPPKYGIFEDPVTGTACGALGAWLISQGRIPADGELTARQGIEMGRGGAVRVRRIASGRMLIRGQAVAVLRGEITV